MEATRVKPVENSDASAAHRLLDRYQHRLNEAAGRLVEWDVTSPDGRSQVQQRLRQCLGVRDEWIPTPRVETLRQSHVDGFSIRWLGGTSWSGVRVTALLYVPGRSAGEKNPPLVLLGCGHGEGGKLNAGYQQMARALVRRGAVVLCPDNLGQGERRPMGHRDVVGPFACGVSVQGLIAMETLGWLRWARENLPVDTQRIAGVGNSGGGLLSQMLLGLDDTLVAAASTGYPSTYGFIAAKEKKHCHCNILPGIVGSLEMHQVYGSFAPKPLLLMQGEADHLFPADLFHLNARRTRAAYQRCGAADNLATVVTPGGHSWDGPRIEIIARFMAQHLGLAEEIPAPEDERLLEVTDTCLPQWPADALTTDQIAAKLTGSQPSADLQLWDVFPIDAVGDEPLADVTRRGDARQVLAQLAAFAAPR